FPAPRIIGRVAARVFELLTGPEDGLLGAGVEALRIEQGPLIVVAQQAHVARHDQVDAFARVGTVADDVTETVDFGDPLLLDICQHGLETFEVAMDIADDSSLHTRLTSATREANARLVRAQHDW